MTAPPGPVVASLPGVARLPSPIQPITDPELGAAAFNLIVKRDDLISADFPGNKWRKLALNLEADLVQMVSKTGARGVLIDISAVSIVDSFMGRIIGNIANMSKILDAETVVVGMQPAVAITLIELGLPLTGVYTALNVERGMELLNGKILIDADEQPEDDSNSAE